MKTRTILLILVVSAGVLFSFATGSHADPDKASFISKVVYRTDAAGDYQFDEIKAPGTYEFTTPHLTGGAIYSLTANYEFTGEVALQVSATGKKRDYFKATDGIPHDLTEAQSGNKIIWKATLAEGSTLTEVSVTYVDAAGVLGSFGNPELTGFMFRKPIYLSGDSGDTFHYQVPIKVGESSKATDCDVHLKGVIQADFSDCRFTKADQETVLPHYLEYIKGEAPNRTALFYVRIPQIPEEDALLYLYYGNSEAQDTSDGSAVFDFFDDFNAEALDTEVWDSALDAETSVVMVSDSELRLDGAKVSSKAYKVTDGILEYRAKSQAAAIESLITGAGKDGKDIVMFSSTAEDTEHSIALGTKVKANDEKPITLDTYYSYRVIADGKNITFQRYDDYGTLEAEVKYKARSTVEEVPIALYSTADSTGSYYDYVRMRKYLASPPAVDTAKTEKASEEVPNIAVFTDVVIAANGDLTLKDSKTEGQYISPMINAPFKARIIVPSWKGVGAGVDISAKEYATYKEDCSSGSYYYASKEDFTEGNRLRFRVRFSQDEEDTAYLSSFTMDFRPGTISVVKPNGGEKLEIGRQYPVYWDASQYDSKYKLDLSYSIDGGKTFTAIGEKVLNSGTYPWTTPLTTSNDCVLRVSDSLDSKVYDTSNAYFSLVPEGEGDYQGIEATEEGTEEEAEDEEEEEEEEDTTKQLYELLIKADNSGDYKEGDIVMIQPEGFIWGKDEREKFLIVKAKLTKAEVVELMKPEMSYGKVLQRRRHKIDLKKQGLVKKKLFGARQLLRSKPLLEREAIEMKRSLIRPKRKPISSFLRRLLKRVKKKVIVK